MEIVSVVIPTHNRSELIENAVKSVLKQTYTNFEIIIVDDASADNTESIVKSINSEKITYIKIKESRGGNYARNLGAKNSKGSFIAFLDDDDEWLPNKLETQMKIFAKNPQIGLIYTGAEIIYKNNKYIREPKKEGNLSKTILMRNFIGTTSSVVVRKEIFNMAGGFDNEMPALQDYDLWIRICQITNIGFVREPLIKYYNHANINQITDNLSKIQIGIERIDHKYKELISQLSKREQKKRIFQRYNGFGKRKLRIGEKKEARKYFLESFKKTTNITSIKLYIASFFEFDMLIRLKNIIDKMIHRIIN